METPYCHGFLAIESPHPSPPNWTAVRRTGWCHCQTWELSIPIPGILGLGFNRPPISTWWLTYPSEKWWISSVGMMTFPTEWKKKNMFQTTNQIWSSDKRVFWTLLKWITSTFIQNTATRSVNPQVDWHMFTILPAAIRSFVDSWSYQGTTYARWWRSKQTSGHPIRSPLAVTQLHQKIVGI